MPYSNNLADRARRLLAGNKQLTEKKMFGGIGFLLNGNMLVGVWKDSLIVRIGPDAYDEALAEPYVREFDITGRPMTGWVMVEPDGMENDRQLANWIDCALEFVRTLPKK